MSTIHISPDLSSYSPLNLSLTQWLCVFCSWVGLAPSQVLGLFPKKTKGYMTHHRKVIYNPGNIQLQMTNQKLTEMGSWNNIWVKNLPVRPLVLRRKTPGQLYPINNGPPDKTN